MTTIVHDRELNLVRDECTEPVVRENLELQERLVAHEQTKADLEDRLTATRSEVGFFLLIFHLFVSVFLFPFCFSFSFLFLFFFLSLFMFLFLFPFCCPFSFLFFFLLILLCCFFCLQAGACSWLGVAVHCC